MVTKELIKTEVDKVRDENLEALYAIVKALEEPEPAPGGEESWQQFVASTYGSLADAPIERGAQGQFEARAPLE